MNETNKMLEFTSAKKRPNQNPIDWFNNYGDMDEIFKNTKKQFFNFNGTVTYNSIPFAELIDGRFKILTTDSTLEVVEGELLSPFQLLTITRFNKIWVKALNFVLYDLMKIDFPYVRVGTDYFKIIESEDRYGSKFTHLKAWKESTIKQDYGNNSLDKVSKFTEFVIEPNNINYEWVHGNCYNLYSVFQHHPFNGQVDIKDIPVTFNFMQHIFGEQIDLGFKYIQILYQKPKQILPILTLVSTERETGKTTFINWIQAIFGENTVLINSSDISSTFNSLYATKNIIMVDETVIEKNSAVERLKSIATAKTMTVNQKHISQYSLPFYGKIILCTNKETDFMKIDSEEIRFWVRKINSISGVKNTNIELDLVNEIPKLLAFLNQLEPIVKTESRMYFSQEEIITEALESVKDESRSGLYKEMFIIFQEMFNTSGKEEIYATLTDLKNAFYRSDSSTSRSYIKKVLTNEFKMKVESFQYYFPLLEEVNAYGTPYKFERKYFTNIPVKERELNQF